MPEEKKELRLLEKLKGGPAASAEEPVSEASGEPEQSTGPEQVQEPPVSRAEFDQIKAERDQLLDRLARLQAEFENARKRAERERIADRDYAAANVVEKFLPVMDHFEMALKSAGTAEQLRSGVELIVKQMEDVLRQLQVTAIPAAGRGVRPAPARGAGLGGARTTCPTSTWPRRFAAATSCATGCCARRWCASPPTPNRQANRI